MAVTQRSYPDVTGYIMAGGRSRRLGVDKRQLRFGEDSLLELCSRLLLSALGEQPCFVGDNLAFVETDSYRIINDKVPERGPLGGLVSLLEDCKTEWALVLAVDLPYLSQEDLEMLLNSNRSNLDVLTLTQTGEPEPMVGLYNKSRLQFWHDRLQRGELGMRSGICKSNWDVVSLPDESSALKNINYMRDLWEAFAL